MFEHKPKNYIFLIHGIGGHKGHFGFMVKALRRVLHQEDPSVRYIIRNIEYNTGDDEKTPYDFAQDIDRVIRKVTDSDRFRDEDKISLIMHSQGGIIGSIWLFQSLMESPGYNTPKTIDHVDSFITLGTPFWGAKMAQWGSEMKELTGKLGVKVPLPFGHRELEEMSFGSDMIYDFRQAVIDEQYKIHIDYLREKIRFLNIVGVANVLNPLGIFVSGTEQYEDDGAVPLASARFNFLYSRSIKDDYEANDRVPLSNTQEINLAPYVMVNAMHISPLPEMEAFPGIAQIPKKCIKEENHQHPVFPYLWNHIIGNKIKQLDGRLGDFKTFLIDLNIRAGNENVSHHDLKIEFFQLDGSTLEKSNIEISSFLELYSEGKKKSAAHPDHCRFYYTGNIKKLLRDREEALLIKISGNKYKTRFLELKVKESYSSFVDINLLAS